MIWIYANCNAYLVVFSNTVESNLSIFLPWMIPFVYLTTDQTKTVEGFKNKTGILSAISKQQTRWFKYFSMKTICNDFLKKKYFNECFNGQGFCKFALTLTISNKKELSSIYSKWIFY